jgi:hypothetical protein
MSPLMEADLKFGIRPSSSNHTSTLVPNSNTSILPEGYVPPPPIRNPFKLIDDPKFKEFIRSMGNSIKSGKPMPQPDSSIINMLRRY